MNWPQMVESHERIHAAVEQNDEQEFDRESWRLDMLIEGAVEDFSTRWNHGDPSINRIPARTWFEEFGKYLVEDWPNSHEEE